MTRQHSSNSVQSCSSYDEPVLALSGELQSDDEELVREALKALMAVKEGAPRTTAMDMHVESLARICAKAAASAASASAVLASAASASAVVASAASASAVVASSAASASADSASIASASAAWASATSGSAASSAVVKGAIKAMRYLSPTLLGAHAGALAALLEHHDSRVVKRACETLALCPYVDARSVEKVLALLDAAVADSSRRLIRRALSTLLSIFKEGRAASQLMAPHLGSLAGLLSHADSAIVVLALTLLGLVVDRADPTPLVAHGAAVAALLGHPQVTCPQSAGNLSENCR